MTHLACHNEGRVVSVLLNSTFWKACVRHYASYQPKNEARSPIEQEIKKMRSSNIPPSSKWITHLLSSRIIHRLEIPKLVDIAERFRIVDTTLLNSALKAYIRIVENDEFNNAQEGRDIVSYAFRKIYEPDTTSYVTYLGYLARQKRMAEAQTVFKEMLESDVPRTSAVYNTLLDGFSRAGMLNHVRQVFNSMEALGTKPDERTFSILTAVYGKHKDFEAAEYMVSEALSRGFKDAHIFTCLLAAYAKEDNIEKAEEIANRMKLHQIKPTTATYNTLISMYSRAKKLEKVNEAYKMLKQDTNPDLATFTTLLDCYQNASQLEDFRKTLFLMVEMGYNPTFAKYSYVVMEYISRGQLEEASRAISYMSENSKLTPDAKMINQLIEKFSAASQFSKVVSTWKQSLKGDIKFDQPMYNAILSAACQAKMWMEVSEVIDAISKNRLEVDDQIIKPFNEWVAASGKPMIEALAELKPSQSTESVSPSKVEQDLQESEAEDWLTNMNDNAPEIKNEREVKEKQDNHTQKQVQTLSSNLKEEK